ncbi:MAG: phospholipase D-like domain-containing protein [Clostridia bacterium]
MRRLLAAAAAAGLAACVTAPAQAPRPAQRPESPLVQGNDAQLLVDGPQTHGSMFAAMERARDHINLETYILEGGEVGERAARIIEAKVKQGVKVNVLYDGVGSIATPKEYFQRLKDAGAALCEFNPVNPAKAKRGWDINNRNHRKITVVDGQVAFTGGINISSTYSSGSRSRRPPSEVKRGEKVQKGWRDTDVKAEGPVVARFQHLFLDAWTLEKCPPLPQAKYFPRLPPRGKMPMRVVSADPDSGKSEMYGALLSAIRDAKKRAWLTIGYFVPDPESIRTLEEAARRGIDVRLVLPGVSDFWAPVAAGRSHYGELLAAGVKIYEWRETVMHAKTAVVDDAWASVGSTNLDWRSIVHNYEADLIVYDPDFTESLARRFQADVKESVEIRADQWADRGVVERAKEWLARRWEYFL